MDLNFKEMRDVICIGLGDDYHEGMRGICIHRPTNQGGHRPNT